MSIQCAHCGKEITSPPTDWTFSDYKSERTEIGQHTGDIYTCDACGKRTIDDHLNRCVREWNY